MPTYVVTSHPARFHAAEKESIVQAITRIHSEEGGNVPQYLVQVIFNEVQEGNWFINKRPVPKDQVWVRGDIRPGRSDEQKTKMCQRMTAECAKATGLEPSYWWVYICDADKTSEFGSVLPAPGEEKAWVEALGKDVRDRYGLY